jgi:peptidoglycan/LPS O-acetylase OafA/YrhL
MLGIYRYILALMVACGHLWPELIWWSGVYAVFCFYIISGYLMCLVLNEVYSGGSDSFKYIANRALRIYPPYLVVLCLSAIAAYLMSEQQLAIPIGQGFLFKHIISYPATIEQWLANISLLFWNSEAFSVSQAWSLRIELIFYVVMIFLVRRRSSVIIWFALSVLYAFYLDITDRVFLDRYITVLGSSLAFSFGALIYHFRSLFTLGAWHVPIAAILFSAHLIFARQIWNFGDEINVIILTAKPETYGIYVNLFLGGYLLYAIICNQQEWGNLKAMGRVLGDIAYAIFLLHWLVAVLLIAIGVSFDNKLYFMLFSFIALNAAAFVLYQLVEKPVNRHFRDKVRSSLHSRELQE